VGKHRIDVLLVERGLAESRSRAQRLVMAGQVRVDGQVVAKSSSSFPQDVTIEIEERPRYVSRGGYKLQAALEAFEIDVAGRICVDVGASTGGFTDCLLQHGARQVYAIEVGKGILHWKLRQDTRVVVMEGANARDVHRLPEPPDLVTIDAAFISLKLLLPVVLSWLPDRLGEVVALIKPQFEAGKAAAARGAGVITDPEIHRQVLRDVLRSADLLGFTVQDLIRSPLRGPKGNVEFLAHLIWPGTSVNDLNRLINPLIIER
jgi:23S rRNA (cytidine1920-2'-O)/16S rRNA (cytidine1409-2'-O)-methyltransferase